MLMAAITLLLIFTVYCAAVAMLSAFEILMFSAVMALPPPLLMAAAAFATISPPSLLRFFRQLSSYALMTPSALFIAFSRYGAAFAFRAASLLPLRRAITRVFSRLRFMLMA